MAQFLPALTTFTTNLTMMLCHGELGAKRLHGQAEIVVDLTCVLVAGILHFIRTQSTRNFSITSYLYATNLSTVLRS
jgi:hypothetical protein